MRTPALARKRKESFMDWSRTFQFLARPAPWVVQELGSWLWLDVHGFLRVVGRRVEGEEQRLFAGRGHVIAVAPAVHLVVVAPHVTSTVPSST